MTLPFTKMQGAGNDYIYINAFEHILGDPFKLAIKLSDRHFGIGADGLVLIMPSDTCDLRMRMFNADGSEAQMCGNASRCVGKYAYEKGLVNKTCLTLETKAGIRRLHLQVNENRVVESVTVDMGQPDFAPESLPVSLRQEQMIDHPLRITGFEGNMTCVSMGNPHAVFFVNDVDNMDIRSVGRQVERHPLFPEQTNVEFAQIISPTEIRMRVWERGSGETLACGTGACATLVAAVLNRLTAAEADVHCQGGTLHVRWDRTDNDVFLTGPAAYTFEGTVQI